MAVPELLRQCLSYDPSTGEFRWIGKRKGRGCPYRIGEKAGHVASSGYLQISFDGTLYYGHRLAWWFVHGDMPTATIDHRDGNRGNNRIANLRMASQAENCANRAVSENRKFKGAYWRERKLKWQAALQHRGRFLHLGYFDQEEDAARAYDVAARRCFGGFACTNFQE